MKTILLLTDFSTNAGNAAQYALRLAQKIRADLLLFNVYNEDADEQNGAEIACVSNMAEKKSMENLGKLSAQLKVQSHTGYPGTDFIPSISQCNKKGPISKALEDIACSYNIVMVVISPHHIQFLSGYLLANHAKEIVENAVFPILVVPHKAQFKSYETIAFASNLAETDINILQSLVSLAKYSDSEITITHVVEHSEPEEKNNFQLFLNRVASGINYPNIFFHNLRSFNVAEALRSTDSLAGADLLVLVYRKRNLFQRLYEGEVIQKLLAHPSKPLLIFPYSEFSKELPVY